MQTLLQAPPEQLAGVRERAEACCVAFSEEVLPPDCTPGRARVGVEIDPATGIAQLHIERGVTYVGPCREVAEWVGRGTRTFSSFDELQGWLAGPLAAAYAGHGVSVEGGADTPTGDPTADLDPLLVDSGRLVAALEREVVGQTPALTALAEATTLHLARRNPRRPLTALALGPSGVGKTLAAETLADAITEASEAECRFLRLDMSEFQEPHTVSRLLGAPPGYIGHGDATQLVTVLRPGGRSVVLLDEWEKAHRDICLAIMNLMDAGRLTPAAGATIDARHAILILTTNLVPDGLLDADDAPRGSTARVQEDAVVRRHLREHHMPPELVGRLHALLPFRDLRDDHLDELLSRVIRRSALTFGLEVQNIDDSVTANLRSLRPDPGSGARGWEYLVDLELGSSWLDAVRAGVEGRVNLLGWPPRVEPSG